MAVSAKLPNASRRDSQGICFLGNIDYNALSVDIWANDKGR